MQTIPVLVSVLKWSALALVGLIALGWAGMLITEYNFRNTDYPLIVGAPDWSAVGAEDIPHIVTHDLDGSMRLTQLWIATLNNVGYLRALDSKWFANVEREQKLQLRIGGNAHNCHAQLVQHPELIAQVQEAFRIKYANRTQVFQALGIKAEKVLQLDCTG